MLTDKQCEEFRRLPLSFNDMVRAIHDEGIATEQVRCIKVCRDHWDMYAADNNFGAAMQFAAVEIEHDITMRPNA